MSTDLNEQIRLAYEEYLQHQQTESANRAHEAKARDQQQIEAFRQKLAGAFGDELVAALKMELRLNDKVGGRGGLPVEAVFDDGIVHWSIYTYVDAHDRWSIKAAAPLRNSHYLDTLFEQSPLEAEAKQVLLIGLGLTREQAARSLAEQAESKRQQAEAVASAARQRELDTETQRQAAVEAERVNAEIEALIAARIDEARASLWQWKDNIEITFYRMRWCASVESSFEDAYTLVDELDERGYIATFDIFRKQMRRIKLDAEIHKPTWERLTASSVEQLPWGLAMEESTRIEGIGFYSDDLLTYREDDSVTHTVASVPVTWVRRVVEATAIGMHGVYSDEYYADEHE